MKPIFALFLLVKGGLGFQFGSMKLSTIPLFHLEDELKKDRMSGVSRRNAFALGLAIASISQIPQETIAAMEVSEADPEFLTMIVSYRTPQGYDEWRKKLIEPNLDNGKFAYPSEMKVVRQIFGRSRNEDGTDTVHAIKVFPKDALPEVLSFYDDRKNDLWDKARNTGLLDPPVHKNIFKTAYFLNNRNLGPPNRLAKGSGVVFGSHGINTPFKNWAETFNTQESSAFLESMGISSVAFGPNLPKDSTDAKSKSGVGIVDFFPSYADAKSFVSKVLFEKNVSGMTVAKDKKNFEGPLYLELAEVTDDYIYM